MTWPDTDRKERDRKSSDSGKFLFALQAIVRVCLSSRRESDKLAEINRIATEALGHRQ